MKIYVSQYEKTNIRSGFDLPVISRNGFYIPYSIKRYDNSSESSTST